MEGLNRRKLITGLIAFGCTPAIVRAESLMKVKAIKDIDYKLMMNKLWSGVDIGTYDFASIAWMKTSYKDGKIIREWINSDRVYIANDGQVTIT